MLGGLRPHSDLDVLAVVPEPMTSAARRELGRRLLGISGRPRPIEVTVVATPEVKPWRYPPRMELQYGDWLRAEFERGEVEPPNPNPDLAVLIAIVLQGDLPLAGPPPGEIFDPVPLADVLDAMGRAVPELFPGLEDDTRNSLLTLARIWHTFGTGEIAAKDVAAAWALARLPSEHRQPLARAHAAYLGEEPDRWGDLDVRPCADRIAAEIDRLR